MKGSVGRHNLAAMTMNQYLGADLLRLARFDRDCFAKYWLNVNKNIMCIRGKVIDIILKSDIEKRVKRQAEMIIDAMPDIVGLQETLILNVTDPTTGEIHLEIDYLSILMSELDELGGNYKITGIHEAFSMTLSRFKENLDETKGKQNVFAATRDVLLVLGHQTPVANVETFDYFAQTKGKRGFVSAEVMVRDQWYKVVNTHLETSGAIVVQLAQAIELMNVLSDDDDIILLGDFNSKPGEVSYRSIISNSFVDVWLDNNNEDADVSGFTAIQSEFLDNNESELSERIDLILYRGSRRVDASMRVYGDSPADKTPEGFWPSDHAFVYGNLSFAPL